ncbi:MAG: NCS2 family permease [Bacteroidaceae bacterium]|nr:NCS2 family permease [Bacteroidaceae bacterium]
MLNTLFGFDSSKHSIKTEIIAGITTFLTMAYILAINPDMFADLGKILGEEYGMPKDAVFTATALAAIVGTLIMAIYAKKPFGLAPGMGLNAFFVYNVCIGMGYSWQFALTAILIEGIVFIILSATNVRDYIVNAFPIGLKQAIGVGIGLYIAFIGLQNSGIIVPNATTSVALGKFNDPKVLLAVIGLLITSALVLKKVKGGMLIGILITTIIGIPMGITHINGFADLPPSIAPICWQFDWKQVFSIDMLIVVFTFLFMDMFDTMGTVVGVSVKAGMIDKEGKVDGLSKIFMADAVATTAGACFGTNTTTTYIESSAGVAEGGRTGLTAFTIAVCFILALFFSPVFLAVPSAATGPVLAIVGVVMCSPVSEINWKDYSEAIPAFFTMLLMPLAYSISDGIMLGLIIYVFINLLAGNFKKLNVTICILTVLFITHYITMLFI